MEKMLQPGNVTYCDRVCDANAMPGWLDKRYDILYTARMQNTSYRAPVLDVTLPQGSMFSSHDGGRKITLWECPVSCCSCRFSIRFLFPHFSSGSKHRFLTSTALLQNQNVPMLNKWIMLHASKSAAALLHFKWNVGLNYIYGYEMVQFDFSQT